MTRAEINELMLATPIASAQIRQPVSVVDELRFAVAECQDLAIDLTGPLTHRDYRDRLVLRLLRQLRTMEILLASATIGTAAK